MTRFAATLPGYASVARASQILHLAPRSVRDLIYAGRVPSLRIGRLHFIQAADLEQERRRRLGLPKHEPRRPTPRTRTTTEKTPRNRSLDGALRRQRATERADLVKRWSQRHSAPTPTLPLHVLSVVDPLTCEACSRVVR